MLARRTIVRLTATAGLALAAHAQAQTPLGTGFTYQGRLDQSGSPANGTYDLQFALFNAAAAGAQVGTTQCADNVPVVDGLFTVTLDFGAQFNGEERWLGIGVRADASPGNCGSGVYTPLAPRQAMSAAPYALKVRGIDGHSLDAADGSPVDAVLVDDAGAVGIANATPTAQVPNARLRVGGGHVVVDNNFGFFSVNGAGTGLGAGVDTTTFDDLQFFAGGAPRFWVLDTGQVGIGTETPQGKLDIEVGTGGANLQVFEDSGGVPTLRSVQGLFPGALRLRAGVEFRPHTGALNNAGFVIWNEANTAMNSVFTANGTSFFRGGPVAVGTNDAGGFLFAVNGTAAKPGGGSWSVFSDTRLKSNIEPMRGTLDRLLSLRGYTFEYRPEAVEQRFALPGTQIGLLAQEVEMVFPDWVSQDAAGYKYVTERATTALMVEALRELRDEKDAQIRNLRNENAALAARLDRLEETLADLAGALRNAVTGD